MRACHPRSVQTEAPYSHSLSLAIYQTNQPQSTAACLQWTFLELVLPTTKVRGLRPPLAVFGKLLVFAYSFSPSHPVTWTASFLSFDLILVPDSFARDLALLVNVRALRDVRGNAASKSDMRRRGDRIFVLLAKLVHRVACLYDGVEGTCEVGICAWALGRQVRIDIITVALHYFAKSLASAMNTTCFRRLQLSFTTCAISNERERNDLRPHGVAVFDTHVSNHSTHIQCTKIVRRFSTFLEE